MSDPAATRLAGLTARVIENARAVVAGFVLLAVLAGIYAVLAFRIDTSTTDMIAADVAFRQHAIRFEEAFPRFHEPLVAVIEAPTPEQAEAAASALAIRLRTSDLFEGVEYLPAHPFFKRNGLLFLETDELERVAEQLAAAQPLLAVLAERPTLEGLADFIELALVEGAGAAPPDGELPELLASMARTVGAVNQGRPAVLSWRRTLAAEPVEQPVREIVLAQPRLDNATFAPADEAITAVRAAAADLGIGPAAGLRLRLTGDAVLQQEEFRSVRSNALLAATLSALGVALLLVIGIRSWRLIAATLLTLGIGLVLTAAAALLLIGRLNLISVTFAVLFVGLGVDFGIHLVLRFREALDAGLERRGGLAEAVPAVAGALALSALCAALGFLAFVPTDYQGLAELGVISAIGMAIALVASLTLLPALLSLFGPAHLSRVQAARRRIGINSVPRVVLPVALVLGLGSIFALPLVGFDFNPLNLQDPESESVVTFERLAEDTRTSPYSIDVMATDLEAAKRLADRLRALPAVGDVVSLEDFVPDDQTTKLEIIDSLAFFLGPVLQPADAGGLGPGERRAAFERLRSALDTYFDGGVERARAPGAAGLETALARFGANGLGAARLQTLEQALVGALPTLLEQLRSAIEAGRVTIEDLPEELVERWVSEGGRVRLLVRPAERIVDNEELRAFAEAVLAVEPAATGMPVVVREAGEVVVGAFQTASWIALGAITLVLAVVLRRPLDVLLVLIPLLLAVLLTAATAVLLDVQLNFANVIVLPLLLGLGVSGAIHVVLRARQTGPAEDLERTSTPRAVLFSALTTVASFGSLAISDHRGLASMGLLLTIAILWSLVCTLLVLPNLLALRPPRGAPS